MAVDEDVTRVERERDEAREALRGLLGTRFLSDSSPFEAWARAEKLLEGVERTHALVPVEALADAANLLSAYVAERGRDSATGSEADALSIALRAATRGEQSEWPS